MKKLFYITILFSLCIGFTSCSNDDEPSITNINENLIGEWFLTKYECKESTNTFTVKWDIEDGDTQLGACTSGEVPSSQELRPQRLIIEDYGTEQFDFSYYRYNPNYSYWVVLYYGGIYSFTGNIFYDQTYGYLHERRYVKELTESKLVIVFETTSVDYSSKITYTYYRY